MPYQKKEMYSRDTTVLIDLCDLMLCTTLACFSAFSVQGKIPSVLVCYFFGNTIIISTLKIRNFQLE